MHDVSPAFIMIGLNVLMMTYSIWVISSKLSRRMVAAIGLGTLVWLVTLHWGLSNQALFPKNISGIAFLSVIFAAVGAVGLALLLVPWLRQLVLALDQRQLMLLQGIRVFFGAAFLVQASLGVLPQTFGIVDGITHISAGFFGLIASYSLAVGVSGVRRAWFANIFGLIDILMVAGSLAFVLLPQIGPHHSMMYAVFLPAPLWFWFHLISIWKLLQIEVYTSQASPA